MEMQWSAAEPPTSKLKHRAAQPELAQTVALPASSEWACWWRWALSLPSFSRRS